MQLARFLPAIAARNCKSIGAGPGKGLAEFVGQFPVAGECCPPLQHPEGRRKDRAGLPFERRADAAPGLQLFHVGRRSVDEALDEPGPARGKLAVGRAGGVIERADVTGPLRIAGRIEGCGGGRGLWLACWLHSLVSRLPAHASVGGAPNLLCCITIGKGEAGRGEGRMAERIPGAPALDSGFLLCSITIIGRRNR